MRKPEQTIRIMTGPLSPLRYAQVVYLTAPAARPAWSRGGWWSENSPGYRILRAGRIFHDLEDC